MLNLFSFLHVKLGNPQKKILKDLQTFINRYLRKKSRIFGRTISNEEPWSLAHETPLEQKIKRRKWTWIRHTFRKGATAIENQTLNWNPQEQQRKGRPRMTCKRTVAEEAGKAGKTWKEVRALAQIRVRWRCFVEALCSGEE
jgi:hypothetical protein